MATKTERGEPKLSYYELKKVLSQRITNTLVNDWLQRPIEARPKFSLLVMAVAREYGADRKMVRKIFDDCFPMHTVDDQDRIVERES